MGDPSALKDMTSRVVMDAKTLVEGLSRGDDAAWRAFLASYGPVVYAVSRRFAADGIDPEDLFQETCLRALRSIDTLQNPERIGSWVYTIAYRLGIDALRRGRLEAVADPHAALEVMRTDGSEPPGPDHALERLEQIAQLIDALGELDERCRRLLTALYLEEPAPPYAEIGRRQGMPIGSIGPTRARCLLKLKNLLGGLSDASAGPSA